MKKIRFFTIITLIVVVVFTFLLASPLFKLSKIEINFVNMQNKQVLLNDNKIFNTPEKVNNIISSVNFDYGDSIFLINKDNYINKLECKNPYIKLVNITSVFPNKLLLTVQERSPVFFLLSDNKKFLIDSEFKILDIIDISEKTENDNLIQIKVENNLNIEESFFSFFDVSFNAFEAGQYLCENNLVILAIKNCVNILSNCICFSLENNMFIENLIIKETSSGTINIKINTKNGNYGVLLQVENILNNFDKKFKKLIYAFNTLIEKEKIKTTYGILSIDDNANCYWNNL